MSRKVYGEKVRIQLAGQSVFVLPQEVVPTERRIMLNAERSGWCYRLRKSTKKNELLPTAMRLLREDGTPRGITFLGGEKPSIVVAFHVNKQPKFRSRLCLTEEVEVETLYRKAVNRIRSELKLSDRQYELLIYAWPAFHRRYAQMLAECLTAIKQRAQQATRDDVEQLSLAYAREKYGRRDAPANDKFKLLRSDGTPRGMTIGKGMSGLKIHVAFNATKEDWIRFSFNMTDTKAAESAYIKSVNRIVAELGLSDDRHKVLVRAWPAFFNRYLIDKI